MDDEKRKANTKFVENWRTESPDTVARRELRQAAESNPINMDNYQNIVKYRKIDTVEGIRDAMLNDMVRAGASVGPDKKQNLSLGGINDDRKEKGKKFKMGVE